MSVILMAKKESSFLHHEDQGNTQLIGILWMLRALKNTFLSVSRHDHTGLPQAASATAAKVLWPRYSPSPPTSSPSPQPPFSPLPSLFFSQVPPCLSCLHLHHFSSEELEQSPNWWLHYKACHFQCYLHFFKRGLFKAPASQCSETCYGPHPWKQRSWLLCTLESPGELVKIKIANLTSRVPYPVAGMGAKNLHFQPVLRRCW